METGSFSSSGALNDVNVAGSSTISAPSNLQTNISPHLLQLSGLGSNSHKSTTESPGDLSHFAFQPTSTNSAFTYSSTHSSISFTDVSLRTSLSNGMGRVAHETGGMSVSNDSNNGDIFEVVSGLQYNGSDANGSLINSSLMNATGANAGDLPDGAMAALTVLYTLTTLLSITGI